MQLLGKQLQGRVATVSRTVAGRNYPTCNCLGNSCKFARQPCSKKPQHCHIGNLDWPRSCRKRSFAEFCGTAVHVRYIIYCLMYGTQVAGNKQLADFCGTCGTYSIGHHKTWFFSVFAWRLQLLCFGGGSCNCWGNSCM